MSLIIDANTIYDQRVLKRLIKKHRKITQNLEAALAEMSRVTVRSGKRKHLWEFIAEYLSESGPQMLSHIQSEMVRRGVIKDKRNPPAQVKKSLETCRKFARIEGGRYIFRNET